MSQDFLCPNPMRWNKIFLCLCAAYEKIIGKNLPSDVISIREMGGPPTPLILNGWIFSTDAEKRQRWLETIDWASRHNLLDLVIVEDKDKYFA